MEINAFDAFRNYVNALVGRNQEFEQLLQNKDIDAVLSSMVCRKDVAMSALNEYDPATHDVMRRPNKIKKNKNGERIDDVEVAKLPIAYQSYINEIALVFLFGQPIKWIQSSEGTDNAFQAFNDIIKRTRFNSHIRECKRIAGSETESAMLFRVFKNDEGKADVQIRVLANSKNDEIYTRWDNFENLLTFAWGYWAKEGEETYYHLEVYTNDTIYHCKKAKLGWEVVPEKNLIGKIPVIYFKQNKEWAGVEQLIKREEFIASRTADTNDYFANPIAVLSADIVKNMPDKEESGKLLIASGDHSVNDAVKYLTWDSAPESKRQEIEWLQNQILSKSFTPNITLDTLKSLSNLSGKALRTVMLLAEIKANKHKETYDEMLDRTSTLITSIIGNVLNISLRSECDKLVVDHEFQEPFGDDIEGTLNNIAKSVDSGLMSNETAVTMNPLVKDPLKEIERLNAESEQREADRQDIFSPQNEI